MKKYLLTVILFTMLSTLFAAAKTVPCTQPEWAVCLQGKGKDKCNDCKARAKSYYQEEWPISRCSKRLYCESHCNYTQECAYYCARNQPLASECDINETCDDSMILSTSMLLPIVNAYDLIVSDTEVCEYEKKCFQYGYCPQGHCKQSIPEEEVLKEIVQYKKELLAIIDKLIEEEESKK